MPGKPLFPTGILNHNYTMVDTDSVIIASGVGTIITLPNGPPNGHQSTVVRADAANAIKVNAGGADLISLAGVTASQRSLNTNGASLTMSYVGGTWYITASQGTVA